MAVPMPSSRSSELSICPGRSLVQECVRVRLALLTGESTSRLSGSRGSGTGRILGLCTQGWPTHCSHSVYHRRLIRK